MKSSDSIETTDNANKVERTVAQTGVSDRAIEVKKAAATSRPSTNIANSGKKENVIQNEEEDDEVYMLAVRDSDDSMEDFIVKSDDEDEENVPKEPNESSDSEAELNVQ